jgi:hypothetical protein
MLPMRERIPMQFPDNNSDHRQRDAVLFGLVVIGASLRLWQYLANTSLWVDEIFLTTSILDRPMRQLLTTPLAYGQVAPKGFLLLEKLLSASLGPSDLVLRLFPLLCSLAGLIGFAFLVRLLLEGLAAPVALALFATAPPLVAYTSQVKQYSSDVAVAVLLLCLAADLAMRKVSLRRSLVAGALGAISVWFSVPAVLVVAALVSSLALVAWSGRSKAGARNSLALIPALAMWSISALAAVAVSLATMSAHTYEFMHQYWAEGFLPTPPWRAIELRWPWRELKALVGLGGPASLGYPFPRLYLLLIGLGFWLLWRRLGVRATLLLMPVAVTLSAAIIHQYPFADRLILFLVPILLIALAASVDWLYQRAASWSEYLGWFLCIVLVGPLLYPIAAYPPPYRIENMKPVMAYLEANWRAGDAVYVFHGALPAFGFYSADYGFRESDYVIGGCHRGENVRYREELDAFRGRPRVWVVLTHAIPSYHERDDIVSYLDAIGVRRDYFAAQSRAVGYLPLPAEVMLYDLSDPHRLESATATSIPLVGPTSQEARYSCGDAPPVVVPPRRY